METIAVGNFAHDAAGREQVMFTVGWKSSGHDQYTYKLILTGVSDNAYYSVFNAAGDRYYYDDNYMGLEDEDGSFYDDEPGINYVPVAVDIDNDGLKLGYAGKTYAYTDPEVVAILQAAPYFSEADNAGQTTYTISTSYTKTSTSSNSVSFGVGVTSEIEAGAYRGGVEAGYALDWEESFEKALTTTKSIAFTAGEKDTVIVQRTPVTIYAYAIWDDDINYWQTKADGTPVILYVEVPIGPAYYQLTVDKYNEFVDEYADYMKGKGSVSTLSKITDSVIPLNADGNPQNYYHRWTSAGTGGKAISDDSFALSTGDSSITSSVDIEESFTEGTSMSHGFHFSTQHGAEIPFRLFKATVQIYFELDYSHSTGHYTTEGKAKGSSGTVNNVKVSNELPAEIASQYGFNWQFGLWESSVQKDASGDNIYIPVLGYVTTNVTAPAAPVTDLKSTVNSNKVKLSWSNPNNKAENSWRANKGFNVYVERGDKYVKLNDSVITGTTYTYTPSDNDGSLNFTVRAISDNLSCEGAASNVCSASVNVCGDTTGNGLVQSEDGTYLARYIAGYSLDGFIGHNADVDGDGFITPRDSMILARSLAGWTGYKTLPYKD